MIVSFVKFYSEHPADVTLVLVLGLFGLCVLIALWPTHSLIQRKANHDLAVIAAVGGAFTIVALVLLANNYAAATNILKGILP